MKIYKVSVNNNNYDVLIKSIDNKEAVVEVNGVEQTVKINEIKNLAIPSEELESALATAGTKNSTSGQSAGAGGAALSIKAPIPGQIKVVHVKKGDKVKPNQKILVMEAMKMENVITSTGNGIVKNVLIAVGDTVTQDQMLIEIGE